MSLGPPQRLEAVRRVLNGQDTPARDLERFLVTEAHGRLKAFVQQFWSVIEPAHPLEWSWYHDLLCDTLERVTRGELRYVCICIPPGFAKSLIVSVLWPTWWWLREPSKRILSLSSSDSVVRRDSRRMRDLIASPWYQRCVALLAELEITPAWSMTKEQEVRLENSATGGRFCYATGGALMGDRGDGIIVDDPHQLEDAIGSSEHVLRALGEAHDKIEVALPSRVIDRRCDWFVLIMQRLHQDDAAGHMLERPETHRVILPMRAYDHEDPDRHPLDPREPEELLDPVRVPDEAVAREASRIEGRAPGQASAQHQQRPVPASGGTFKRAWTEHRYPWHPQRRPETLALTQVVLSCDLTFKKTRTSSYVSLQVWARVGWTEYYLLDEVHARLSYTETKAAIKDLATKWTPHAVLVEGKANGPAIVDDLKNEVPHLIDFNPDTHGDKEARAQLSTTVWLAGEVWLPLIEHCPWVVDYVNELCSFPAGILKDRVDAQSQVHLWWHGQRVDANKSPGRLVGGLLDRLGIRR